MVVLGITDGQTSGAAIVEDGEVLAAINEERIVRMKLARGAPRRSIAAVLEISGLRPEDIGGVAIAGANSKFKNEVRGWNGWFEERSDLDTSDDVIFSLASKFSGIVASFPQLRKVYYLAQTPIYLNRRKKWQEVLKNEFEIVAPVRYFDHHYCHAAGAYYTSGFENALVVTLDGGGDGSSSHIYHAVGGRLKLLNSSDTYNSLGNYYAYITAICGFKAQKHEGKITGLAAHGEPIYYDYLSSLINYEDGRYFNKGRVVFEQAKRKIENDLPDGWKSEDLAASIQRLSEDIVRSYVRYWLNETKESNVALSGGVFANVRINQEINELPQVNNIYVHPGMSDEGLGLGAAMALWWETGLDGNWKAPIGGFVSHVYFGPEYTDRQIITDLRAENLEFTVHENIEREIAELLADGYVVARFNGRMEYGPRALGNRSILYHPTDNSVNDWLNKNLVRTEFMPFAPSTLIEEADKCYENINGGFNTARFMTITFDCTPWMKQICPGVVHVDGTARPQLVDKKDNPSYYRIIEEFYKITGIPTIINTSFNMHEEPIVCSPEDAIQAFRVGHLDYLAIGSCLVKNSRELTHELNPCRRAKAYS
jgi:carbamoyltransferase